MAVSLLQQLNGERAVVLLYIIRILFSTPLSLLPEACSLSLLSLFALCVEISVDDASNPLANYFRTRPGASSGILLGAVTLPGVMVSRLIQSLRAFSLQEVGIEEIEYLKLQFWAVSAICFTVLVFLCIICRSQGKSSYSISSLSNLDAKFSLICLTLLVELGLVSLSWKLYGWPVALMTLWVLCHGFTAVKLIQRIIRTFPACASIGEALLVTTGLVVYFGDMLAYTAARIPSFLASSKGLLVLYGIKRSEKAPLFSNSLAHTMQGVIIGLLIFPIFYKYVIQLWESFASLSSSGDLGNYEMRRSLVFYASLTFMLAMVVPSWMQLVHSFKIHPLLWVLHFVFSEPFKSLTLCAYWLVVIYFSVRKFYNISKNSKTERILLRKYYHLMAVSIFVPALIFQASMVGHKYGVLRWSKTGKKTIEGTAAGITSVLAACFILLPLLAATGYIFTLQWFSLIVAVTISGLLEAYTAQLDNAFIPLVFYSLLCL
ncbi:Dolichol kinase EVAN [Sesamum angolense]|uniref:dolichol kinase n=1 Tax=Sesamum angolense TaxID=2727404 RepID=A0AAE1XBR2_9LAMI|nr:Dolichol kinase EVAN [Sesamum angolense]